MRNPATLSLIIGLLSGTIAPMTSSAVLIDFETFPDTSPVPFGATITNQYATWGVTFSQPTVYEGPRIGRFSLAGQSGLNALIGFDPIEISFSTPVSAVSILGLDVGSAGLQLHAFNILNILIDSTSMSGIEEGVGNFGTLSAAGSSITKLVLSHVRIGDTFDPFALDNLNFTVVPEPSIASLFTFGIVGLFIRRNAKV